MTLSSSQPWWMTDLYEGDTPLPAEFTDNAGPEGVALVKAWPSGQTDAGWGLNPPPGSNEGFMPRYNRGEFNARRALFGFNRGKWAFAIIMRSVKIVCVDIDGKNGGLEHAKQLGMLPPTLAETSKSGNGYHLYYLVDDQWDEQLGFAELNDRIGIEQGVDIRATGCVYHFDSQRWNDRPLAVLPDHLLQSMKHREQKHAASTARINKVLENNDPLEVLMMQDQMLADLAKPIAPGKRNNTLFAIGSQLHLANVPGWEDKVRDRAHEVGLDQAEVDKLIGNITRYATPAVTP